MSKFECVLSDEEMAAVINNGCTADLFSLAERVEQATLAKLAGQEPVMYARTYNGEIDWDEACVTEENDGMLMHATDMSEEDFIKNGYAVIPLYAHPMPCVSSTSHKTACVSESEKSDTQQHLERIKRYQKWRRGEDKTMDEADINPKQIGESLDWLIGFAENHIAEVGKMVPEGWQLVPVEPDQALLVSMATCLNHGFGLLAKEKQDGQLYDMRKLYDEVVGKGYYSPKTRERYLAMLAAAPKYTGEK